MKLTFTQRQKKLSNLVLSLLTVFAFTIEPHAPLSGQTCTYTIQMFDSFGDGWNGGILTVVSAGITTTHTLPSGSSGSSTFQVTTGQQVVISWTAGAFAFEPSFNLVNPDGLVLLSIGQPIPAGVVYDAPGLCPNCPAPNPSLVIINQITDTTAFVNWLSVPSAENYYVEYGPLGFVPGTGIFVQTTDSQISLSGLNPGVDYQIFIASYCGVDSVSAFIGPYNFQTTYNPGTPGDTCTYTLEFYDSFGDGWNGSVLTVNHNGISTGYTLPSGNQGTFTFNAISNLPIVFSFTAGAFLNETSYDIIDPNGIVIFSNGPFPLTGTVFTTIACPTCPGPISTWLSDVNATNAKLSWIPSPDANGPYIIEYGPVGFTLGAGTVVNVGNQATMATLNNLTENTWYNVYIKLDCGTEFSKSVGPLFFHTLWVNDMGVSNIIAPNPATACNLSSNETVTISMTNFGQAPQTLFEFYFAVNGQVAPIPIPQDGLFTGVIGNDSTQVISFETNWDFSIPGFYLVEAWTNLEGDSNPANDTFRVEIVTAFPKPIKEDFEDNAISPNWVNDGVIYAPNSHNNATYVLADNLFSGDPSFSLTTSRVGPVMAGDSLFFDYRYVNWFAGTTATTLGPDDKLEVQISTDCEETYQTVLTINSTNHITSTDMAQKVILLDAFAGFAINVRFLATWGSGDYWLDLDNINVTGCPESLVLLGNVKGSAEGGATGSIDLTAYVAQGPLTVVWTNSSGLVVSTEEDPTGLAPGIYTVQVTDVNGCQDSRDFEVGILVGTDEQAGVEQISLYPNPTSGLAFVDLKLNKRMELRVRLFNTSGQLLFESEQSNGDSLKQELDLTNQAPGMYILQVVADGKPYYAKLMVTR